MHKGRKFEATLKLWESDIRSCFELHRASLSWFLSAQLSIACDSYSQKLLLLSMINIQYLLIIIHKSILSKPLLIPRRRLAIVRAAAPIPKL